MRAYAKKRAIAQMTLERPLPTYRAIVHNCRDLLKTRKGSLFGRIKILLRSGYVAWELRRFHRLEAYYFELSHRRLTR